MSTLRTDDPISRRIVRAFIDFLDSVEPAPSVDLEGLQVARDCLTEVFSLDRLYDPPPQQDLLLNLFSSHENSCQNEHITSNPDAAPSKPAENSTSADSATTSRPQENNGTGENSNIAVSKDELFGQFFAALEGVHYFRSTTDADDDHEQLERVTSLFHDAVNEMEHAGCKQLNHRSLADALKTLGNKAMQSSVYSDAIERYTCAIALGGNDAVYYCNRAAAYTQLGKYDEAIRDCYKSIEIDRTYSKAYSRLGLVYYAQGKYGEAIHKGFRKALLLDPNNDAVKENIRAAQQKLREDHQHRRPNQGPPPSPFSVTFDATSFPPNVANMFTNMPMNHPHDQGQSSSGNIPGPNFFGSMSNPADLASMISNIVSTVQQQHQEQHQSPSPQQQQQSTEEETNNPPTSTAPNFTSMPFDPTSLPTNFSNMFANMAGGENGNHHGADEPPVPPEISVDGNISFNFEGNDQISPEAMMGTLRSVMGMFSSSGTVEGGTGNGTTGNGDNTNNADGNRNDNTAN